MFISAKYALEAAVFQLFSYCNIIFASFPAVRIPPLISLFDRLDCCSSTCVFNSDGIFKELEAIVKKQLY